MRANDISVVVAVKLGFGIFEAIRVDFDLIFDC